MRSRYLYITLLSVLSLQAEAQGTPGVKSVPRLVVNINIDQLDSDHLEWYSSSFGEGGFLRLLAEGMVFERASYPFEHPDRASAITTLVTGTHPFYHLITGQQWVSRTTLRRIHCTEDPQHPGIPSPMQIAVSTIGDELKLSTDGQGKVFAFAPMCDAAVLSAGHAADGAFWTDPTRWCWTGSQYYSNTMPSWLLNFNELKKPKRRNKKYQDQWLQQQQFCLTDLAANCIEQEGLGQDSIPDLLLLTLDASRQDEQTYVEIDRSLSRLIAKTDSIVGHSQTLYILTSTGYHTSQAADQELYRIPTGTFYINRTANLLNMYFGAVWGTGRYVETCLKDQIYLNHQYLESKQLKLTDVLQRAQEFISQMSGVKRVTTNSFHTNLGDLQVEVAPGWHIQDEDTHEDWLVQLGYHAFPIIVVGPGITPRHVTSHVSVDRIAPAIAKAIRIRAPNACKSEPLF